MTGPVDRSPPVAFHLARPDEWAAALASGRIAPASLEVEGFVHCSTAEQLAATVDRHFAAERELVVLQVDLDADGVREHVQWAEVRPGERFPHVHAPLPLTAVMATTAWRRGDRLPGARG